MVTHGSRVRAPVPIYRVEELMSLVYPLPSDDNDFSLTFLKTLYKCFETLSSISVADSTWEELYYCRTLRQLEDLVILNLGQMTRTTSVLEPGSASCIRRPQGSWVSDIYVTLFSFSRAFSDEPRHFEPRSSDVDDT
ncbi:hypothetical protein TNCV_1385071 [Trichonephila clavipes]|nr:hypothetical protein TNCV_1385071 [Trichonephila clavipes]